MTSQTSAIERHLRQGKSITALSALRLYGCMRLASRIHDLVRRGAKIKRVMIKHNGKRYAKYYMEVSG